MKLKYKILMGIIVISIGLCLMLYQSYALWVVTLSGQENIVSVGCFNIEFLENSSSIALNNSYPVSDQKGMSGSAYSFTVTNKCTVDSSYQVTLNTLNKNTMGDDKVKYAIYKEGTTKPSTGNLVNSASINTDTANLNVADLKTSYIIASGELRGAEEENATGESHTYHVYLWIDENAGNEVENTKFEASINITNASVKLLEGYEKCVADYGEENPECQIMASVDTTGSCPTVNDDGSVQITGIEDTKSLVCSAPDDYGTSYYFRGNVTNNYVKFAGYYWRIIRVNGDGSIRMIYAGDASVIDALPNKEEVLANGYDDSVTKYTQIGESAFNANKNLPLYVGYMYGDASGTTLEEVNANIHDSTIKVYLENWYNTNLSRYSTYLADAGFCNDRTLSTRSDNGNGVQTDKDTYYAAYDRRYSNYNVILTCPDKTRDLFTVNNELGNKASIALIGLVTLDELMVAGASNSGNTIVYLYTGKFYWSMSPSYFSASDAAAGEFYLNGDGLSSYGWLTGNGDVRPVINLKSGSLKSGSGTALDPYTV